MEAIPHLPPEQLAQMAKEDVTHKVIVLVATFTTLGFVCVCLRFLSRIRFVRLVGLEDYLIAFSMVMSIFTAVCLIETARWGNGRHFLNLPLENGKFIMKYLYFSIISYHMSLTATKLSILWQYRRVFTYKQMRIAIYFAMGFCLACGLVGIICATLTCIPLDAYWNLAKRPFSKCVNQDAMYHANAGLNISTDLLVAVLPVKAILKLKIALKQKIALLVILTIGWFVVIVSIIRLYVLILVANHPTDTSWYGGPTAYWSAIEVNLAIVCASTPALRPLVVAVIPAFASRIGTKRSARTNSVSGQSSESRNNSLFVRLKSRPSVSTVGEDSHGGLGHGVAELPHAARYHGQIHVTKDFERRSINDQRFSDNGDSRVDLFRKSPVSGGA